MRKRGQIFAIYLVVLTLFLCSVAVGMHYINSKGLGTSLVSPKAVMWIQDRKEVSESVEKEVLIGVARDLEKGGGWGTDEFSRLTRDNFCTLFARDEMKRVREFFYDDLFYEGRSDWGNTLDDSQGSRNSFCLANYEFSFDGDKLVVRRKPLGKVSTFFGEKSKINFAVDFKYTYEKEYLIGKEDLN